MSKVRRSLARRLNRSILFLAVLLFVLSLGVFYQYAQKLLYKEAVERTSTTLSTTTQLVNNYLSTIEVAAKTNVWLLEQNFSPDSLPIIIHRIVHLNSNVLSCSVAAEPNTFQQYGENFSVYSVNDGDTIRTELEPEFEYFEKNWYKKPLQMGRPCWINPFSDFNEGTINHHDAVGSYCIPLRPHGNKIEGVVSVDFSFQRLRETVLATHHPYPSSYYMILGPVGGYLVHPESSLLFKKSIFTATDSVEHSDIVALGHEMTSGKYGTMQVKFDDALCLVSYMPITDTGWSIALVCHKDDVLADYNHLAIIMIIIVLVGMLLIAWITNRVVRRNIGPLNKLLETTKNISEGRYDAMIPISDHKDVVGKLQNAFRKMQQAIVANLSEMKLSEIDINEDNLELERILPLAQEESRQRHQFIQNVFGQISLPINIIEGLVSVLKDSIISRNSGKPIQNEEFDHISTKLKQNAGLLRRFTLMLYDSSDIGIANAHYQKEDIVLCNELAQTCINRTQSHYSVESIAFDSELPDSFSVKTNRLYLTRTISELLYNAAKFSDGQHISLHVTKALDTVDFVIEDVGPGLPENLIDQIFLPFTKVDNLSEGLGLGLPLTKHHMEGIGGEVIYDESYQQGCRFIVKVPQ